MSSDEIDLPLVRGLKKRHRLVVPGSYDGLDVEWAPCGVLGDKEQASDSAIGFIVI